MAGTLASRGSRGKAGKAGKAGKDGATFAACAGWAIPQTSRTDFGPGDSILMRYATRLAGVEINSSFYRPHLPGTYARWADSVPEGFRFAVKVPRAITHERRLRDCESALDEFLGQVRHLGGKLDCLLLQLPPSLAWDAAQAQAFFAALRERHPGPVVLEPRHTSWFTEDAQAMLAAHRIDRVNADPAPCAGAAWPLDSAMNDPAPTAYYRLHGFPRKYYSAYDEGFLQALAQRLSEDARHARSVWCVFDNTAEGAATANALAMAALLIRGLPG